MAPPKITVLLFLCVLCTLNEFSKAQVVQFRCDELEAAVSETGMLTANAYCTVTDFYVNVTTQVKCDVYAPVRQYVLVIKFYNSKMRYIPSGLFRYFNNVRDLDLAQSEIEDIHRNSFEGAKDLTYLTMSYNNITELRASVFVGASLLFVIELSYNQISKIDKYAFVDVRSLSRLHLSHNLISSLEPELFQDMKFLDQVFLDHNEIAFVEPTMFEKNVQLSKVSLASNRIIELEYTMFNKLFSLVFLNLSNNMLTELRTSGFGGKLSELSLKNNNLKQLTIENIAIIEAANNQIENVTFRNPLSVKHLILSNNSLTNIYSFSILTNLQLLDLSYNDIGPLHIAALSKLEKLEHCNLAHTGLSELHFGTFAGQKELRTLDISYNNLGAINFDMFSPYFGKLEKLFINGNNLTTLGGTMHLSVVLPALKTIGLSDNNFNCSYLASTLRSFAAYSIAMTDNSNELNTTHVSGIACTMGNGNPNGHLEPAVAYASKSNSDTHGRDALKEKMTFLYSHLNVGQNDESRETLQMRVQASERHEKLLQSNLTITKVLLVCVCGIGLVWIAFQFVRFYMQQSQGFQNSIYRSTTTMNTILQSNLEQS